MGGWLQRWMPVSAAIIPLVSVSLVFGAENVSADGPVIEPDRRVATASRTVFDCADILKKQSGGWCELAGASIADVFPGTLTPSRTRANRASAVIDAWNGAAWDPDRMILYFHGGSISDYGGGEVYSFALGTGQWRRLTGPVSEPAASTGAPCKDNALSLARRARAPLVVEYRDRYFEDPYHDFSRLQLLRKQVDRRLENWWMKPVRGIITVSDPWSEDYRTRFGLPVTVVYNGFDPDDFPVRDERSFAPPEILRIVYTGVLYSDRRDPSPLFAAIKLMGEAGNSIQVDFYGADPVALRRMASDHGVLDRITANDRVSYRESIDLQMNADILLLLQWNDPKELGNVPGKVFEYVAARRPVLGLGPPEGVPARILRERGAGVVVNEPEAIAVQLAAWLAEKNEKGVLPLLPETVRDGLSRSDQYAKVEAFLQEVAGNDS